MDGIVSDKSDRGTILDNFASSVSLHGFFYVHREQGVRKFLWYILLVGAIAMAIIMFHGVTMNFFEYKTYVALSDFHYHNEDLILPTVTVCNKIPLIRQGYERVKKLVNITEKDFEEFHLKYLTRYQQKYYSNYTIPNEDKIFDALSKHNITKPKDLFNLFEINKDDMFNDPIAKLFLTTRKGDPDYPTCRYNYKYRCDTRETLSWKESLCHGINYFQRDGVPRKGWVSQRGSFGNMITVLNLRTTSRFSKTKQVRISAPYMDLVEGVVLYVNPYGSSHHIPRTTSRIFLVPGMWNFVRIRHTEVWIYINQNIRQIKNRQIKLWRKYFRQTSEKSSIFEKNEAIFRPFSWMYSTFRPSIKKCYKVQQIKWSLLLDWYNRVTHTNI